MPFFKGNTALFRFYSLEIAHTSGIGNGEDSTAVFLVSEGIFLANFIGRLLLRGEGPSLQLLSRCADLPRGNRADGETEVIVNISNWILTFYWSYRPGCVPG